MCAQGSLLAPQLQNIAHLGCGKTPLSGLLGRRGRPGQQLGHARPIGLRRLMAEVGGQAFTLDLWHVQVEVGVVHEPSSF